MLTRRSGLRFGATVAVILASYHSNGFAAPPDKACALLTTAEITAQVGAPGGEGKEVELPAARGSAANKPTKFCVWTVSGGNVQVSFAPSPDTGSAREAFRATLRRTNDALKARGWTIDEKKFGEDAACWTATPPPNGSAPHSTGCVGETNHLGVAVGTNGTTTVEIVKVKKLLDAAMSRVH